MSTPEKLRGRFGLAAAGLVVWVIWIVVLPAFASRPAMSKYLDRMDQAGIDASAMFYTELEMMPELIWRIEGRK